MTIESPRKLFLRTLREEYERVRSGQYDVRRGPYNMLSHVFSDDRPFLISVMLEEFSLFRSSGTNRAIVSVFAATRQEAMDGIDDAVTDVLTDDLVAVIHAVEDRRDDVGDSVAIQINLNSATVGEFMEVPTESEPPLQGIHCQFEVTY